MSYQAKITDLGVTVIANALATSSTVEITEFAVGDASGTAYVPTGAETDLVNKAEISAGEYKKAVTRTYINPNASDEVIIECILAKDQPLAAFTLREVGLYDTTGILIAIANTPEIYKPTDGEGALSDFYIRLILKPTNVDGITINVSPTAPASREYVDTSVASKLTFADVFSDVVVSGYTGTNVGYILTIATGVAYVDGQRVEVLTGDADLTQDLSGASYNDHDVYVHLSSTGVVTLHPVAHAAGAPSVAAGTINIMKVVTNGVTITTITDDSTIRTEEFVFTPSITYINSTDLQVVDKNILINKGGSDASSEGAGLTVTRTGTSGSLIYADAAASKWKCGALGGEVEIVTLTATQALTNKTLTSPDINGGTIDGAAIDATTTYGGFTPTKTPAADKIVVADTGGHVSAGWMPEGALIQVVYSSLEAASTNATTTPNDDTIPQNTEGTELITVTISPKYSDSILRIRVVLCASCDGTAEIVMAIFQDTGADAIAAFLSGSGDGGSTNTNTHTWEAYVAASSTSSRTYKLRAGTSSGSLYVNRDSARAAFMGGVMNSMLIVEEIRQ